MFLHLFLFRSCPFAACYHDLFAPEIDYELGTLHLSNLGSQATESHFRYFLALFSAHYLPFLP